MDDKAKHFGEVFNRDGAAKYLKVRPETISRWCTAGTLRHAKIGGALRIRREWCDELIECHASGGKSEQSVANKIAAAHRGESPR